MLRSSSRLVETVPAWRFIPPCHGVLSPARTNSVKKMTIARRGRYYFTAAATAGASSSPVQSSLFHDRSHHCGVCYLSTSTTDLTATTTNETLLSTDGVAGRPIDFDIPSKIEGHESQIVTVTLEPGNVLRAESGALMYMTEGCQMQTTTDGGLSAGFSRYLTGQNVFISDFTYEGADHTTGQVTLGTDFTIKCH